MLPNKPASAPPPSSPKVQDSFDRQGLMKLLGAALDDARDGRCLITLPFSEIVTQQHGYFHGAAIGSVADVAGGYAALSIAPEMNDVMTVEYKINFVAPAAGELLRAEATVVARSRRSVTCRSDVFVRQERVEKLCAVTLQTLLLFE